MHTVRVAHFHILKPPRPSFQNISQNNFCILFRCDFPAFKWLFVL
ncbi:hypothetical protein HMPREF3190_00013 [Umbribacter vaginalis]|nr:hypothetical protein HMPREF3190_00013 [Coriobacteriales bacterium DNF00809]